jgi:hypothetical protein
MITFKELLIDINACKEARLWAGDRTIEEVLRDSWRGDWLLWLAKKLDLPLNKLTLAKSRCAKTVIHLMKDKRSIDAVNVAEKFGLDECTLEELNSAAYAAYAAAADADAYADDAADDDDAAAYAYAAYAVAASADDAADAAAAYAYAAYAASSAAASADDAAAYADDARKKNRQKTSDICVEILGELLIKAVNNRLTK